MKKLYTLLAAVILTASAFAQAPDKMSYQAIVRDAGDALVTNQGVGMQLSILQGSISGTAVYVETQTSTTNINGLVSIEIGSGTVVLGTFNTIDWSAGPYFIMTETDPTGGTIYTITGTSQLMSVPYALHAKTAENVTNDLVEDADADPANELQTLALSGSDLTILGGNTITFDTTEGWTTPTLENGWVNFGSDYAQVKYYKDKEGRVHLKGLVKDGTLNLHCFTLPVGYRPATNEREIFTINEGAPGMSGPGPGQFGRVDIMPDGRVMMHCNSNLWNSLAGISFRP